MITDPDPTYLPPARYYGRSGDCDDGMSIDIERVKQAALIGLAVPRRIIETTPSNYSYDS